MIRAERDAVFPNRHGKDLFTTVTMPDSTAPCDAVLFIHGFKGFRNWGFFPYAAQEVADRGMIAIRMDTSMNGMNGTNDRVIDVEAFASNTITREVDDVHDVITHMTSLLDGRWNGVLHLVGHSRGGGVAHVVLRERLASPLDGIRIGRSVIWNGLSQWMRWTPRQRSLWMDAGYMEFENARTGQLLRMNTTYILDIEAHAERLDLPAAATAAASILLYLHADQDVTVPIAETYALHQTTDTHGPLIVIERSTHTFGMTHPPSRVTSAFAQALHHTMDWIGTNP